MAELKDTDKAMFKTLAEKYGLTKDHFFTHKFYTIITRAGIDQIAAAASITIRYQELLDQCSKDHKYFLVKATGSMGVGDDIREVQSYGEVSPDNNKMAYPISISEKRAASRVVLKLTGFYALGVFGEDEADDFKRGSDSPAGAKPKAVYKGN